MCHKNVAKLVSRIRRKGHVLLTGYRALSRIDLACDSPDGPLWFWSGQGFQWRKGWNVAYEGVVPMQMPVAPEADEVRAGPGLYVYLSRPRWWADAVQRVKFYADEVFSAGRFAFAHPRQVVVPRALIERWDRKVVALARKAGWDGKKAGLWCGAPLLRVACPVCGGTMVGDGFNTVLHCENADESRYCDKEPDAPPVYCEEGEA